ncbi:MAG: hypothetical protein JWM11_514 [Planctomycetaceae bacterium]|nr:hypothetical protein [Planctomycetaceae bacterium]
MLGLTPLGIFHTAISLIAVVAGFIALVRDGVISPGNWVGRIYITTTVITCVTGFGIFRHGAFGIAHVLGIITLVVLAIAGCAGKTKIFGSASRFVEVVSYSTTFFFHLIPALTETATRLPVGSPLAASPDAPLLQAATGFLFVAFLVGVSLQVVRLRAQGRQPDRELPAEELISSATYVSGK